MTTAALHPETLVRDDGVRREIYRDPEVFALEMERIFKRTWVFMAHESELPAGGDYLTMRIGAEPVVLARGEDDEVRALVNRCRHRGAIVCERAAGNAKSFRCQYHGWTYRNDGPLVGVPYPERHSADVRERLGLIALPRVESYRGLIFASFNPDVPPLADYLGPGAIGYIDRFLDQCLGLPLVAHRQAHRIAMEANWKLQLENGMDGYHARIHPPVLLRRHAAAARDQRPLRERPADGDVPRVPQRPLRDRPGDHLPQAADEPRGHPAGSRPSGSRCCASRSATTSTRTSSAGSRGPGSTSASTRTSSSSASTSAGSIRCRSSQTVVSVRPLLVDGAPEQVNWLRLRYHELFYGPAGFGQPDDFEMFERVEAALGGTADGWFRFERGLGAEQVVDEGDTTLGNVSDETPQRGQYRQWTALMTAEA